MVVWNWYNAKLILFLNSVINNKIWIFAFHYSLFDLDKVIYVIQVSQSVWSSICNNIEINRRIDEVFCSMDRPHHDFCLHFPFSVWTSLNLRKFLDCIHLLYLQHYLKLGPKCLLRTRRSNECLIYRINISNLLYVNKFHHIFQPCNCYIFSYLWKVPLKIKWSLLQWIDRNTTSQWVGW